MPKKYTTKDGRVVRIKVEPYNEEAHDLLNGFGMPFKK